MALESGPQDAEYTGKELVITVDRSMPPPDQILTWPSSPAVRIAVPADFAVAEPPGKFDDVYGNK